MYPLSLPTNTLPETTVGCELVVSPVGNPNAHFSLRRGTSAAVRRAAAAVWKRVLLLSLPHPFQPARAAGSVMAGFCAHWLGIFFASPAAELPMGRPDRNAAMRRFCGSEIPWDLSFIEPVVRDSRIFSGVIWRKTVPGVARSTAGFRCHTAQ